jgi:hypothetical protein
MSAIYSWAGAGPEEVMLDLVGIDASHLPFGCFLLLGRRRKILEVLCPGSQF